MKVMIGIPWRPQPDRMEAHDFVVDHYREAMPDAEICEVDTDHEPFNLAAARNLVVREAVSRGADVVVISDADCIITPHGFMIDAVSGAAEQGNIHMPFKMQHYLTRSESLAFMGGEQIEPMSDGLGQGACYVCTPSAYWKAGGSDERFSGWGGEDDAFVAAAQTLVGIVRHDGHAMSLWHESVRDIGSARWKPNSKLAKRYWQACGRPAMMHRIIGERP